MLWNVIWINGFDISKRDLAKISKIGSPSKVVNFGAEHAFASSALHAQPHSARPCEEIDELKLPISWRILGSARAMWKLFQTWYQSS
jgi:hypothetical protein